MAFSYKGWYVFCFYGSDRDEDRSYGAALAVATSKSVLLNEPLRESVGRANMAINYCIVLS
jgi:hypothetical protein